MIRESICTSPTTCDYVPGQVYMVFVTSFKISIKKCFRMDYFQFVCHYQTIQICVICWWSKEVVEKKMLWKTKNYFKFTLGYAQIRHRHSINLSKTNFVVFGKSKKSNVQIM